MSWEGSILHNGMWHGICAQYMLVGLPTYSAPLDFQNRISYMALADRWLYKCSLGISCGHDLGPLISWVADAVGALPRFPFPEWGVHFPRGAHVDCQGQAFCMDLFLADGNDFDW